MVFWSAVLVFIVSIMTYLYFPRSDAYQLEMYQEEGNVQFLLVQHQVAKDYMRQLIMRPANQHKSIDEFDVAYMWMLAPEGAYIEEQPSVQKYVSGLVCFKENWEIDPNCSAETVRRYVITYGAAPGWWGDKTRSRKVWEKAMLRRSHGSELCGYLDGNSINNGQKWTGLTTSPEGNRVLPNSLVDLINEEISESEDVLLCVTPYWNPYAGTPAFLWDWVNNNENLTGHRNDTWGTALIGTLNGTKLKNLPAHPPYTVEGVLARVESGTTGTPGGTVITLNGNTNKVMKTVMNQDDKTYTLSVGDLRVSGLSQEKAYSFVYSVWGEQQELKVYASGKAGVQEVGSETASTAGGDLQDVSLGTWGVVQPRLMSLRIYGSVLDSAKRAKNLRADKKRLGI